MSLLLHLLLCLLRVYRLTHRHLGCLLRVPSDVIGGVDMSAFLPFEGTDWGSTVTHFNGSSDYLVEDTPQSLNFGDASGGFSMGGFFRYDTLPSVFGTIFSEYDFGNDNRASRLVLRSDGGLRFYVSDDGTSISTLNYDGVMVADQWYHIVITVDDVAGDATMYFDGSFLKDGDVSVDLPVYTTTVAPFRVCCF